VFLKTFWLKIQDCIASFSNDFDPAMCGRKKLMEFVSGFLRYCQNTNSLANADYWSRVD
jgi:hypothetical protein